MTELTLSHSHADGTTVTGTTVTGTTATDSSRTILKDHGLRWSRARATWYIPGTRDHFARTSRIEALRHDLTAAGFNVTVTIDDTPRPADVVEAARVERANLRAQRLARAKERADDRLQRLTINAANARRNLPPCDEPLKPGHHSHTKHTHAIHQVHTATRALVRAVDEAATAHRAARIAAEATARTNNPLTVTNRIHRNTALARRYARLLDAAQQAAPDHDTPGAADARQAYIDRLAHYYTRAQDQAEFSTAVSAAQQNTAAQPEHTRHTVSRGDRVRFGSQWALVTRVSGKSVTVKFDGGHEQRAPYDRIDEVEHQGR